MPSLPVVVVVLAISFSAAFGCLLSVSPAIAIAADVFVVAAATVDDDNVHAMTAVKVSKLISTEVNNPSRKFTIILVYAQYEL